MITTQELATILNLLEETAMQMELPSVDASTQDVWQSRIVKGEAALSANEFPMEGATTLLISLISSREKVILSNLEAEELIMGYLSQQLTVAEWKIFGIVPENGDIYVHLSCRMALEKMANLVANAVSLESWDQNECPVCGDSPAFGCFEKGEGKRLLVCGACLTKWRYKRIACAFCKEENPEKLQVVTADEFPGWSAAVCQTCNGYLKTADLRVLASTPNWYKAVMETLPLDYALIPQQQVI